MASETRVVVIHNLITLLCTPGHSHEVGLGMRFPDFHHVIGPLIECSNRKLRFLPLEVFPYRRETYNCISSSARDH